MGLLPQSPSDQGVLPLASVVPAELSYRSAPLNSCLYDSEREWGDGQLEQLNTCTGREESKRRRGERERDSPFLPPLPSLRPPALPSSTLQTPSPTPQDANSWSAAQIPKFQIRPNRRRNNSHIHTLGPPLLIKCPLLLVPQHTWFHLN